MAMLRSRAVEDPNQGNMETKPMAGVDTSTLDRFDYVRFTLADIHGIARGKTVPRWAFEEYVKEGPSIFSGKTRSVVIN